MLIKSARGFAIVELLVIIVVIGILASLTVVAYSGIQERARNANRLELARQVGEVVKLAAIDSTVSQMTATMNSSGGWYNACLGTDYVDVNSDGRGDCGVYLGNPYTSEAPALNTLLSKYAALPSMSSYPVLAIDDNIVSGPFLGTSWTDGKTMLVMEYSLGGEGRDCTLSPLVYYTSTSGDTTMTPTSTPKYSKSEFGVTECVVAIHS